MVETWVRLQSQQDARQKTAEAVDAVRKSWDEKHDEKNDLARFNDTYEEVVEALRARYANPADDAWFAGNEDLLKELDELFTKVKAREADLADIETRIAKEKKGWYRQTLRGSISGTVAEKTMGRSAFLGVLDESSNWADASKSVQRALEGNNSNPALSDVLSKLSGLEGDARAEALIDLFFRDPATGDVPTSCASAAESLRSGSSLEQAVRGLQQGRTDAASAKRQATELRRELADLKRGQAAHMQDKMAKARDRQRKQQGPRVEAALYENLPAGASADDVRACVLCQIFTCLGIGQGHVYVSAESSEEEHEAHVAEEHRCEAGAQCVQLTDEDVSMASHDGEEGDSGPVVCRECAEELKRPTVYCSARCAGGDFRRHREGVHLPARRGSSRSVESDTRHLVYGDEDKGEYHAEDIRRFVVPLDEAVERFVKGPNPDMEVHE
ncbi:hypothetical protein B0T11DRAFT_285477 [Plectosphaerella cucumerina]|uniref:Uncharacterized protein n=1 Tax=Plectosphaerella cucumerina TaxID=40658 RepID=A0A8K0TC92_9PEZI|nr:hypothetical protein B0T11DRAFT_285477 [Plectosphaerella cucumerina]